MKKIADAHFGLQFLCMVSYDPESIPSIQTRQNGHLFNVTPGFQIHSNSSTICRLHGNWYMLHVPDVSFGTAVHWLVTALNTFKRSKSTNRNQYHPFTRHPMNLCDRSGINIWIHSNPQFIWSLQRNQYAPHLPYGVVMNIPTTSFSPSLSIWIFLHCYSHHLIKDFIHIHEIPWLPS